MIGLRSSEGSRLGCFVSEGACREFVGDIVCGLCLSVVGDTLSGIDLCSDRRCWRGSVCVSVGCDLFSGSLSSCC